MTLQSVTLAAPGFRGLNTEETATALDPSWALYADNCVIDKGGRIAARKGWSPANSSAIAGTPDVEQIHEYFDSSSNSTIVSAAGAKLYTGTSTLTDVTGTLSITNNNWQFQNFNTQMVGFQDGEDPVWWDGTGNFELLHSQIADWQASTAYAVGDVVKKVTSTDSTIYMHCTTAGTTGASEPTWNTTVGATTTDNTATWTTRSFPRGNVCLAAFGRIWATDSTNTTLHYSDTLIPYKFSGSAAGSIDMFTVWPAGQDEITALAAFNNRLIIFGKKSIVIYSNPYDPNDAAFTKEDSIAGIGCIARDSVQDIGTDIFFLSYSGVRSLGRTIQETSAPLMDISKNIRTYMSSFIDSGLDQVRSTYSEKEGFYLLSLPAWSTVFCFDTRSYTREGLAKITTWSSISPTALMTTVDQTIYLGKPGYVATYSTYKDNTSSYTLEYRSPWIDFGTPRNKIPKRARVHLYTAAATIPNFILGYDYIESYNSTSITVTASSVSEWGTAEWGIGEYGAAESFSLSSVPTRGYGKTVQFGIKTVIDGAEFSIQRIDLFVKIGSLLK